jgi:hypothetical protein
VIHREPYKDATNDDRWTLDVDPDDEVNYVADVRQWLQDSNTSALSFELLTNGVTVLVKGEPQGDLNGLLPAKLKVGFNGEGPAFATFRVTTELGDDQQFDKTMWFKQVQN